MLSNTKMVNGKTTKKKKERKNTQRCDSRGNVWIESECLSWNRNSGKGEHRKSRQKTRIITSALGKCQVKKFLF